MYIKIVKAKYKRRRYEYVRVVESKSEWGCARKEIVIATLGTVRDVQRDLPALIDGLKALADR